MGLIKRVKRDMLSLEKSKKRVWFHCASVGEFEQARPLIEKIKRDWDGWQVFVTFFSPSGYELRKNYPLADKVWYLPMDTTKNAGEFLEAVDPQIVIFIKYEFWRCFLKEIRKRGTPLYLVSGIFREDQRFFKWWGKPFRKVLKRFTHLFVQDKKSEELLVSIGVDSVTVCGDTRFDRVAEILESSSPVKGLEIFTRGSVCCVAGSTWPPDEELLERYFKSRITGKSFKLIIAPHEVNERSVKSISERFGSTGVVLYSKIDTTPSQTISQASVYILDTVGLLSAAYRYGSFAYIGGGFGSGIHNILEAATYKKPVVFGPRYKKFKEACDLVSLGAAFPLGNIEEIFNKLIMDESFRDGCSAIAGEYVQKNKGATANILKAIAP